MLNFIIYLLVVISGFSIRIGKANEAEMIEEDLQAFFDSGREDFADDRNLRFEEGAYLGGGGNAIVFRGMYDGTSVAIKVVWNERKMAREVAVLTRLKAIEKSDIEKHGIPRVYYYGEMLDKYDGIAMSLFQYNLDDIYENTLRRPLLGIDVLQIFAQVMQTLKYLNKRGIIHNDIKPENIFLRGNQVFIGDFDLAAIDGNNTKGGTKKFGSANFYRSHRRTPMDDLESLIYSLWHVSGISLGKKKYIGSSLAEGQIMKEKSPEEALARVQNKCSKFNDPHVQQAFMIVCQYEWLLSENPVPNYDSIIEHLTDAINQLGGWRPFEWVGQ